MSKKASNPLPTFAKPPPPPGPPPIVGSRRQVTERLFSFTREDKLAAVERELTLRRRVYPRWIEKGRMSGAKAAHEIAVLEAIRDDYEAKR